MLATSLMPPPSAVPLARACTTVLAVERETVSSVPRPLVAQNSKVAVPYTASRPYFLPEVRASRLTVCPNRTSCFFPGSSTRARGNLPCY